MKGIKVYVTNSCDCISILLKLDLLKSFSMCGGTLNILATSSMLNCLELKNCACSGLIEIGLNVNPSYNTIVELLFFSLP